MKRLLFIILALVTLNSCSTYVTNYSGSITVLDSNGKAVKKYENITFQEDVNGYTKSNSFKSFGLNFYDPNSDKLVILSNAVPYIIEYTTTTNKYYNIGNITPDKEVLIAEYENLEKQLEKNRRLIKNLNEDSKEYDDLNKSIKEIKKRLSQISAQIWR